MLCRIDVVTRSVGMSLFLALALSRLNVSKYTSLTSPLWSRQSDVKTWNRMNLLVIAFLLPHCSPELSDTGEGSDDEQPTRSTRSWFAKIDGSWDLNVHSLLGLTLCIRFPEPVNRPIGMLYTPGSSQQCPTMSWKGSEHLHIRMCNFKQVSNAQS